MGADIHGVLQESFDGKRWHAVAEIEDERNYWLFSALADVRNYGSITPISEPRGLPEDFKVDDEMHQVSGGRVWMGDHSYSWLSIDELLEWDGWDQDVNGVDTLRDGVELFLKWLEWADLKTQFCKGKGGRRIVFGFDS